MSRLYILFRETYSRAFYKAVPVSEAVGDAFHFQSGLIDHPLKTPAEEHLAVSVGHCREIDAGLGKVERRRVELLPVP